MRPNLGRIFLCLDYVLVLFDELIVIVAKEKMNISLAVCCNLKGRLKHHLMFQTAFHLFTLYAINPKYLRVLLLSMRLESGCRRCLLARWHLRAYGAKCGHFLGRALSLVHGGRCGVG